MVLVKSTLMNMEFVHALNPMYAFPIVGVILCAFIVYAFGFKSPVQPPSFDAIDEEKKVTKKRKSKENSKVKVIQNGKLNGSNLSKSQVLVSSKKKELEKAFSADKTSTEKPQSEKKVSKKSKLSIDKKVSHDKKKDCLSQEDIGEGGWVQLIYKKGRKNRKKDDTTNNFKAVQNSGSDEAISPEELPKIDGVENLVPEKQLALENDINETIPDARNCEEQIVTLEDCKIADISTEKFFDENLMKEEKKTDESIIKSKKKKKKLPDGNPNLNLQNCKSSAEHAISEIVETVNFTNNCIVVPENSDTLISKAEEQTSKETKSSNVAFDELEGFYPEPKEQRKKKKVRRDH